MPPIPSLLVEPAREEQLRGNETNWKANRLPHCVLCELWVH